MSEAIPLLMNARAGAMHLPEAQADLRRMAGDAGVTVDLILTRSPDDFRREVKRLVGEQAPRIAIAGGDGTVALAVQELAHTQTALGILSQGTFNNFASTLRLPHNLPESLRMLRDGVPRAVDLGKVGDRYFTESAGVGLFADSLAVYGQGTNKNFLRGLYSFARLGLAFRAHDLTLTIDGQTYTERSVLCEVCNTYRIAQAVPIAPEADIADGLLDVVVLGNLKRRELLGYGRALRAQMHLGLPKVRVLRGREVRLEFRRPRNLHVDDDVFGVTPQTVTAQPGALQVLVDPRL